MNDRRIVGARQCEGIEIALTFRENITEDTKVTDRVYLVQRQSEHPSALIRIHAYRIAFNN